VNEGGVYCNGDRNTINIVNMHFHYHDAVESLNTVRVEEIPSSSSNMSQVACDSTIEACRSALLMISDVHSPLEQYSILILNAIKIFYMYFEFTSLLNWNPFSLLILSSTIGAIDMTTKKNQAREAIGQELRRLYRKSYAEPLLDAKVILDYLRIGQGKRIPLMVVGSGGESSN
jgi:hypothetical protein